MIEAPLSVAFDKYGNPKGRSIDKRGNQKRYWYVGPGCVVMVATLYLMKRILEINPDCNIKLFEGLVSYKIKTKRSNHLEDVILLRDAIKAPDSYRYICEPSSLSVDRTDIIESVSNLFGMDFGIPPVIQVMK
ncbi:MAG: hypothetical protein PHQ43_02880 [Dehalococcoidales bacterium]|nr:hypothetical protein [Dehalococcoidales bacterium]